MTEIGTLLVTAFVLAWPSNITGDLIFQDDFESGALRLWSAVVTDYMVTVQMNADTVTDLQAGSFYLYGFKAVESTDLAGRPLVWFRTQEYSITTPISWPSQHYAFTSHSVIEEGAQIHVGAEVEIQVGQIWKIDNTGTGPVLSGGVDAAISIHNTSESQYTCGTARSAPGGASAAPVCAFPLYGGFVDVIRPVEKILLIFSTNEVKPGTVVKAFADLPCNDYDSLASAITKTAYSPGILIDMASATSRTVSFDINTGWSWGASIWAREVEPTENLVPLLIERP